jgi:hypothetical protein
VRLYLHNGAPCLPQNMIKRLSARAFACPAAIANVSSDPEMAHDNCPDMTSFYYGTLRPAGD